ncbi:MAG: hypothetical protein ABSD38_05405 [Syntrophorhabdales bacterium]
MLKADAESEKATEPTADETMTGDPARLCNRAVVLDYAIEPWCSIMQSSRGARLCNRAVVLDYAIEPNYSKM